MGRLIDIDKARKEYSNLIDLTMSDTTLLHTLYGVLDNASTIEAIPKADMIAMLEELQLEIEEQKRDELSYQQTWNYPLNVCVSIIQQKINALRGDIDEVD